MEDLMKLQAEYAPISIGPQATEEDLEKAWEKIIKEKLSILILSKEAGIEEISEQEAQETRDMVFQPYGIGKISEEEGNKAKMMIHYPSLMEIKEANEDEVETFKLIMKKGNKKEIPYQPH